MSEKISIGLPRMHQEEGEKRDFLPVFVGWLETHGYHVCLEHGYGSGMGYSEEDYQKKAPGICFADWQETYQQEYVLVLRYPGDEVVKWMHPGACLVSMLHYPTRTERVEYLRSLGVEGISLDGITDDNHRRLVESLSSVAWNGVEVAFEVLRKTYPSPGLDSAQRPPVQVTLLGPGAVGMHAVQAAVNYGNPEYRRMLTRRCAPGVEVTAIDYDLSWSADFMKDRLRRSDVLIDATQRPDPSQPVIPNSWIAYMPEHAVLLDLSVDPYQFGGDRTVVKGIEGVPHGNLDQYVFPPDDPAYDLLPPQISTRYRRNAVSCYSWPGIHPKRCMDSYGKQLRPLMRTLNELGGVANLEYNGNYFARAISKAVLSKWNVEPQPKPPPGGHCF
jgi:alanine dehydrogenase